MVASKEQLAPHKSALLQQQHQCWLALLQLMTESS
jgi:hypothetical protein